MSDIRDKRELRGEDTLLTATFYRIFTAPEGTLNIEVKVTINNPPIANANGIYTGSYATDPDGTITSYDWDLDDDAKRYTALSNVHGQLLRAERPYVRARGCYGLIKNLFARKKVSLCG